jgi:hypothetical protein
MSGLPEKEAKAWVRDEAERHRWDQALQKRLVSHRIERVRYVELSATADSESLSNPPTTFDSLDYGLEIYLDDGATWSIIWKQQGHNEGLLVYEGTLVPSEIAADAGTVAVDVTKRWETIGPLSISGVETVWTRHGIGPTINSGGGQVTDVSESDICLQTLVMVAPNGREAVITLGQRRPDGGYTYVGDNLAVFFSRDEARAARVLLPGDQEAVE